MRSTWTATELDCAFLVWLVEVHFPGRVARFATYTINVASVAGDLHYPGTSDPLTFTESADLFDGIAALTEMGISGYVDLDLSAMAAEGHRFTGCYAECSQVRAKEHPEGLEALDAYEDRRVLIAGRIRSPQWGDPLDEGGATWFAADVVTEWFASTRTIPAQGEEVNTATWPNASRAAEDEGVSFPVVIGYPGLDPNSDIPVPAAPVCWLDRHYPTWQLIAAAYGVIDASTMLLVRADDPTGERVNLATEYDIYGDGVSTLYPSVTREGAGSLLTVVDYHTEGYGHGGGGAALPDGYWPTSVEESGVYVAFEAGNGGMMWRGRLLRTAADVLPWCLEQTGYRVDWGTAAAAAPVLSAFKIDTLISAKVRASEWLQTSLLPLLPVSLVAGPYGIKVYAWRGSDVGPEECTVIDADADNLIQVSDTAFEDEDGTANRFTIRYGWGAIAKETRFKVQVGPTDGVPETDDTAYTVLTNARPYTSKLRIYARDPGYEGAGIRIITTFPGGATTCADTGPAEVSLEVDPGVTTIDALETAINTSSTLVRAVSEGDGTDLMTNKASPADSRTFLRDYGRIPDPRCRAAMARLRANGEASGIVDYPEIEAPIIMDHGTAAAVLAWHAAAKAGPRTVVSVEMSEATGAGLVPLGPVLFTYERRGFYRRIGYAESVEQHSDGRVSARLVFLD